MQAQETEESENLNTSTPTEVVGKKLRALVVEDDRSQWPVWQSILSSLDPNVKIDWLTTAEEAQKFLRQAYQKNIPYDFVISDILLEGMDTGFDLWNRYGEAAENFVLVSGQNWAKGEIQKGLVFGTPVFFEKPISISKSKKILKEICKGNHPTGGGPHE